MPSGNRSKAKSRIGWTDYVWNPVTGCTKVSPGCDNCYAEALITRFQSKEPDAPPDKRWPNGFEVTLQRHRLNDPIEWKKPCLIFVNSMSDLFHKDIPRSYLLDIWYVMTYHATHHVYQVLTKRAHRMQHFVSARLSLPPDNVWLGVSVENQQFADNRIPALLETPAACRFLSVEPLLEEVDLNEYLWTGEIHWVIAGGESGYPRRPVDPDAFRLIRDQCKAWNVPFYFKQGNARFPGRDRVLDGETWEQMPKQVTHLEIGRC